MHPADEEDPQKKPEQGGQPAPLQGDDGAHHRARPGDGLELIAKEHIFRRGHKVNPIHIHLGRRDAMRVCFHDLFVDETGI